MAILLGALASVLIGGSDFLGRYGTRRSNAVTAVCGALVGGVLVTVLALLVIPTEFHLHDVALGVASGLVVGVALATLYEAMSLSSAAVAGPLVALGTSLFPLSWDLIFGAHLSMLKAGGVAVALFALLFVTYSPGLVGNVGRGIKIALGSAVLWGVAMTLLGETAEGSGVSSAIAQRGTALLVMVALAAVRSVPKLPTGRLLPIMMLSGALGAGGVIAFVLGTQRGSLGAVAVASSMFPAVSATLSATFDDDTLHWWQIIGIAGVIGGISMMALG